jgi:hypothetical protein
MRQKGRVDFQSGSDILGGWIISGLRQKGKVVFEGVTTEREDGEFEVSDRKGRWSFEIVRQIGRFLSIMKDIYIIWNKRVSDRDGIAKRAV